MAETIKQRPDYIETMRVLGQFIQDQGLSEVSILESNQGWIIHGLTFKSTSYGFVQVTSDHLLTHEDVRKLQVQFKEQRREASKRRWGL